MAIRKSSDDVGRGNETEAISVDIAAGSATIEFTFPDNFTLDNNMTSEVLITLPQVSGPDLTIAIVNDRVVTPTPTVTVLNGARNGSGAADNTAIVINANSNFTASFSGSKVTINNAAEGLILSDITLVNTAITNPPTDQSTDRGVAGVMLEADSFSFNGPFTNINPEGDPLQAFARMAVILNRFVSGIAGSESDAVIVTTFSSLKSELESAFPQSFPSEGINRDASALGKIALRGTRRDSEGLVGRGKRTISDTFVNAVSDYGLRQIILRIYDSATELFLLLADTAATAAAISTFAKNEIRDLNIDFGELEAALGSQVAQVYENTIVDRSSDQGLLLYSDSLALRAVRFTGTPSRGTIATAVVGTQRLRLKN